MKFFEKDNSQNYLMKLEMLVEIMKNNGFLTDKKIENAIRETPRHKFVLDPQIKEAYEDTPIPIMDGQTISQPSVVARMTEWLDLKDGQKVLEIGSGSGWQSAILANLVGSGKIFTIERHSKLVEFAKKNLEKLRVKNVKIITGDGNRGLPEESPFDRILITAACKKVPEKLLDQLANGGLLVAPVGENIQSLVLLKKTSNGITEIKNQKGYVFVPFV